MNSMQERSVIQGSIRRSSSKNRDIRQFGSRIHVMRNRFSAVTSILLLLIAMAGTAIAADKAAILPVSSEVSSISVREGRNSPARKITDRSTIEQVLNLISKNNRGWETSWNTFPTPSASAIFDTAKKSPHLVLWFGPSWVGARVDVGGKRENRFWRVPPEIQLELRRLLALNA